MKNWESFNWQPVLQKLRAGDEEIGLSEGEFLEFLDWLSRNKTDLFEQFILCLALTETGLSKEEALFWSVHPDILKKTIDFVMAEFP